MKSLTHWLVRAIVVLLPALAAAQTPNPLIVTSTADTSTVGTLRYALDYVGANCASFASAPPTITFAITRQNPASPTPEPGPYTILPTAQLPTISCDNTTIDGYSQPGATADTSALVQQPVGANSANIQIIINGSACSGCDGLFAVGNYVTIKGLAIHSFSAGAGILTDGTSFIYGNYLGTDPGGMTAFGNKYGIEVGTGNPYIGSSYASDANLITGNTNSGIYLSPSAGDATIRSNLIGGARNGDSSVQNLGPGIVISSTASVDLRYNRIHANNGAGVLANDEQLLASQNEIYSNNGKGIEYPLASAPFAPPILTSVRSDNVSGNYFGTAVTTNNATLAGKTAWIEYFSNPSSPANPEGAHYLGFGQVTLDLNGNASLELYVIPPGGSGDLNPAHVTATLTVQVCTPPSLSDPSPMLKSLSCSLTSEYSSAFVPPTGAFLGVAFNPSTISLGQTTSLQAVVSNPHPTATVTDIDYTFPIPANLSVVSVTPGTDCAAGGGYSSAGVDTNPNLFVTALTLGPGTTCTMTVVLSPTVQNVYTIAPVSVRSSAGTTLSAAASLTVGFQPPALVVAGPSTVTAGSPFPLIIGVGRGGLDPSYSGMSASMTLPAGAVFASSPAVTSTCGSSVGTAAGILSGTNGSLGSPSTSCVLAQANVQIPVSGTYTFTLKAGDFQLTGPTSYANPADVTYTVNVVAAATADVPTSSLSFSAVVGNTVTIPITLTNNGDTSLGISPMSTATTSPATSLNVFGVTTTCGVALAPHTACTVSASFAPLTATLYSGRLDIPTTAGTRTVTLSGTGLFQAPTVSPPSFSFGTVPVGGSASTTLTIANPNTSGSLFLALGLAATGYSLTHTCGTSLAAGASCTATITFTPTAAAPFSGTFQVASSNASPNIVNVPVSGSGVVATAPAISLSASSLTFPSQVVGSASGSQNVVVTNTGTASLAISGVTFAGDFTGAGCSGQALAPGATCSIAVTFNPTNIGTRSGSISIASNAPSGAATVTLTGNGVAPGALSLSTALLDLGNVSVGGTSTRALTLTNIGGAGLGISGISVATTGPSATPNVFSMTHNCPGSLAPASSCTVNITFTPAAAVGYTGSAQATVVANTTFTGTVTLTGVGVTVPPSLQLSATSLTFARTSVGTSSAPQTVTLANNGTVPLDINAISISGDFGYSGCGFPVTLAPGASCTFSITFSPLSNGVLSGAIAITDNAPGSPHGIALTGTGANGPQPGIVASPFSLDLGDVRVGSQRTDVITITSNGTAPLAIASIGATGTGFSESNDCPGTLAVGASCTVTVAFGPTAAGTQTGQLSIQSNGDPNVFNIGVHGNGVPIPPAVLTVDRFVDFGQHVINTTTRLPLQLRNTGEQALNVTIMEARGTGFALEGSCATIAPAGVCTVTLVFTPPSIDTFTGVLTILSNDARGAIRVDLLGQGIAVPRPEIELSVDGVGFANQFVTTRSPAQRVTIRSVGSAPLHIRGISVTGPFELSGSCPAAMAAGTSCDVSVSFLPVAVGTSEGRLSVDSDAQAGRGFASLTGTGCRFFSVAGMRSLQRLCQ